MDVASICRWPHSVSPTIVLPVRVQYLACSASRGLCVVLNFSSLSHCIIMLRSKPRISITTACTVTAVTSSRGKHWLQPHQGPLITTSSGAKNLSQPHQRSNTGYNLIRGHSLQPHQGSNTTYNLIRGQTLVTISSGATHCNLIRGQTLLTTSSGAKHLLQPHRRSNTSYHLIRGQTLVTKLWIKTKFPTHTS